MPQDGFCPSKTFDLCFHSILLSIIKNKSFCSKKKNIYYRLPIILSHIFRYLFYESSPFNPLEPKCSHCPMVININKAFDLLFFFFLNREPWTWNSVSQFNNTNVSFHGVTSQCTLLEKNSTFYFPYLLLLRYHGKKMKPLISPSSIYLLHSYTTSESLKILELDLYFPLFSVFFPQEKSFATYKWLQFKHSLQFLYEAAQTVSVYLKSDFYLSDACEINEHQSQKVSEIRLSLQLSTTYLAFSQLCPPTSLICWPK